MVLPMAVSHFYTPCYLRANNFDLDIYPGNIMVSRSPGQCSDLALLKEFEKPSQAEVHALPCYQLSRRLPKYLVHLVVLPALPGPQQLHAKLIDFGQAFLHGLPTRDIRTPLVFRAPELLLDSKWDRRIDIWALGCTFFELVTGQPPFDNIMPDKGRLIQEWIATFGDLPIEWRADYSNVEQSADVEPLSLTDWLHDCYFNEEKRPEFAEEHLEWLGDLITKMMCYSPEDRLSTQGILEHQWFAQNPFNI